MTTIWKYQLAIMITMAILYFPYMIWWKKWFSTKERRIYLLIGIILSFIIPFIPIGNISLWSQTGSTAGITQALYTRAWEFTAQTATNSNATINSNFSLSSLLNVLWAFAACSVLAYNLLTVFKISKLKRNVTEHYFSHSAKIYVLPKDELCFSYFSSIFISSKYYHSANRDFLLKHELAHIRSYHSYDTVLLQIVLSLQWFNPIAYLIRKELKTLHEYTADAYAADQNCPTDYLRLLLNFCQPQHIRGSLLNLFSYGCIKKRIKMITNKHTPKKWRKARSYAFTIPFFALAIIVGTLSCNKQSDKINGMRIKQEIVNDEEINIEQTHVIDNVSEFITPYSKTVQVGDLVQLKEFSYKTTDRLSVVLKKGITYNVALQSEETSFVFKIFHSKEKQLLQQVPVEKGEITNFTFTANKTSAYSFAIADVTQPNAKDIQARLELVEFIGQ